MSDLQPDHPTAPAPREAYAPPKVVVYGSLADLTQAVATKKNNDNGKGTLKRSQ